MMPVFKVCFPTTNNTNNNFQEIIKDDKKVWIITLPNKEQIIL